MFKKIIFTLITTGALLVGGLSVSADTLGDYEYTDNGDGTAMITNYLGLEKDITIPDTLNGLTVTKLGQSSFFMKDLGNVVIPSSVEEIERFAFVYSSVTNITLNEGLKIIRMGAFEHTGVTNLTLPSTIEQIDSNIVTTLTKATFLGSPTTISPSALGVNPTTIYAYKNSSLKAFAASEGHFFVALPQDNEASIPAMVEVVPGALTFANELLSITSDTIYLNGSFQFARMNFNDTFDIIDARGTHQGYDLQIGVSDFVSGTDVITKDYVSFEGFDTVEIDGVTGSADHFGGDTTLSMVKLLPGKGIGKHTVDLSNVIMNVVITEKTKAGLYDGTLTMSLVSSP